MPNFVCSICLEDYNIDEEIVCTQCGHVFHKNCFQKWHTRNLSCPECRAVNMTTQQIFLHIESIEETTKKAALTSNELFQKLKELEQQFQESEQNFLDVQKALNCSEDQVRDLKHDLELQKTIIESHEQKSNELKQTLEEAEKNFLLLMETSKEHETTVKNYVDEIELLKTINKSQEDVIAALQAAKKQPIEDEICNLELNELSI